jgi:hypothetical protein
MDLSKLNPDNHIINSTIANHSLICILHVQPLQMAADLPEKLQPLLDAFQFIKDVAIDWTVSEYIEAELDNTSP